MSEGRSPPKKRKWSKITPPSSCLGLSLKYAFCTFPNGYKSAGIVVNKEVKSALQCTQSFSGEDDHDHLNCTLIRMKKQGDAVLVRQDKIIMRCIFKDDVLIHAVRIASGKNAFFLTGEDIWSVLLW